MSIRVVLLAAGRGTRLRPLTDTRPKCLLEAGGSPLLFRMVDLLAGRGLTRITVVDGYRGDMVRSALHARYPEGWFRFVRNDDWESTNNAYSLLLARFEAAEPMLLLDSDLVFAPEVLDRLLGDPRPNRLALRTRGALGDEEMKVRLAPGGRVADLGKALPLSEAAGESMGLEVFSAGFTEKLFITLARRVEAGTGCNEFYETAFVELIRGGEAVYPVDLGDLPCLEIDTPEDLDLADRTFGSSA
jgi:choline kinase